MISLKRYLDLVPEDSPTGRGENCVDLASLALSSYVSALAAMGNCSVDACPGVGNQLRENLGNLGRSLVEAPTCESLSATNREVQHQLECWGRNTASHYQKKSDEVKDLLIMMARTAESVGLRDQRCASQIHEVTTRLTAIANLDDLTEIRASIKQSAAELKTSITRMTEEGKVTIDRLQQQVSKYREKLEAAEEIASRDPLTGLRNRLCVERLMERHIAAGANFCVAIVDIDYFKRVNDEHGHLAGDHLIKQLSSELNSACRSTDTIGRWGGDEFILLLECGISDAYAQTERVRKWICGSYSIQGRLGTHKLSVDASIGLAEYSPGESMNELLARADAAMYQNKAARRAHSGDSTSRP